MNDFEREQLLAQMHDAVSLSHDDPRRVALLSRIVEAGAWAERYWIDLAREDELLRLRLRKTDIPPAMAARLHELPNSKISAVHVSRYIGFAAAVMILVGGLVFALLFRSGPAIAGSFDAFAASAVSHHRHHDTIPIPEHSDTIAQATAQLNSIASFYVRIPTMPSGFEFKGHRFCPLAESYVVCTRWEWRGQQYTLMQFDAIAYQLPPQFDRHTIKPSEASPIDPSLEVRFWVDDGNAYALIADNAAPTVVALAE